MSTVIDDDKYHLNWKIPADNLGFIRHIWDNWIDLVNYVAALTSTNTILRTEYEKSDNNAFKATKRIIEGLFSPIGNELFSTFLESCIDRGY